MYNRLLLVVASIAAGLLSVTASAQQALTDTEIRELLVGKTLAVESGATIEYAANGRYTFRKAGATVGNYTIAGGQVCVDFDTGRKRCDRVMRSPRGPYLLTSSGVIDHYILPRAGGTTAQTATLEACELSVGYQLRPPGQDVPESVRAFSGVWVGYWNNQICTALIVEEVSSDGSVLTKYFNGKNASSYLTQAGQRTIMGKISGDTLTLRTAEETIEYRAVNSNELAGVYSRGALRNTATFKRR